MSSLAFVVCKRCLRSLFGPLCVAAYLLVASAAAAAQPAVLVLVVDPSLGLAAERVRAAVADELQSAVLLPAETADSNAGVLFVYKQGATRVVLSYRDPEGHQIERAFGSSEDEARTLATLALLAGNLCRDQLGERAPLQGGETTPPRAPESSPEAPRPSELPTVTPTPAARDVHTRPAGAVAPDAERASHRPNSWMDTVGWIGVGVGGAAFVTGLALRLDADSEYRALNRRCADGTCPASATTQFDAIVTQGRAGTWTATFGVASLATGIALLVFGPDDPTLQVGGTRFRPLLGAGTGGVWGTF